MMSAGSHFTSRKRHVCEHSAVVPHRSQSGRAQSRSQLGGSSPAGIASQVQQSFTSRQSSSSTHSMPEAVLDPSSAVVVVGALVPSLVAPVELAASSAALVVAPALPCSSSSGSHAAKSPSRHATATDERIAP